MNKNKIYAVITVAVIVAVITLMLSVKSEKDDFTDIKPINQVSLQTKEASLKDSSKSTKQALKNASQAAEAYTGTIKADDITKDVKDWSYLAIYRRMEWADVCGRYFWFDFRNKDNPPSDFVTAFTKNSRQKEAQTELDPRATSGLKRYQTHCDELKAAVFTYAQVDESVVNQGNRVYLELEHLLDTTAAKTKKEKSIKTHLELTKEFYQTRRALEEIKKQSIKISAEERSRIHDEMRSLSLEIQGLSQALDSQEALANYEFLVSEIKKLDDQLVNQYDIEAEAYQAAWSHLLQQWITLQLRLVGDDPDVFKLVKLASEWSRHIFNIGISISQYRNDMGFPLKSPGEQMMDDFGVEAVHAFSEAANPAATLYLCGLGYECGAESPLAMQLCLIHYVDMPAACEVSVQDFYLNHALSPNLLEDVLVLYQWMERNYGI